MTSGASHPAGTAAQHDPAEPAHAGSTGSATSPGGGGPVPPGGTAERPAVRVLRVSEHAPATALPGAQDPLSDAERERAATFLRAADRERYLVAHLALRRELAALLRTDPATVPLTRTACPVCGGPHGRPSVLGDPLHFSLSHAGDLVLLAFAPVPVGVDVEQYPEASTVRETASALHPRERAELAALPEPERPAAFTRCWTRKEAYLKGTGTGLGEDPSVSYVGTGGEPVGPPGWKLADLSVLPGYAAASALCITRTADASPL